MSANVTGNASALRASALYDRASAEEFRVLSRAWRDVIAPTDSGRWVTSVTFGFGGGVVALHRTGESTRALDASARRIAPGARLIHRNGAERTGVQYRYYVAP